MKWRCNTFCSRQTVPYSEKRQQVFSNRDLLYSLCQRHQHRPLRVRAEAHVEDGDLVRVQLRLGRASLQVDRVGGGGEGHAVKDAPTSLVKRQGRNVKVAGFSRAFSTFKGPYHRLPVQRALSPPWRWGQSKRHQHGKHGRTDVETDHVKVALEQHQVLLCRIAKR